VDWYVGASGVLHGVMAAGVLAAVRRREWTGYVLGAFLIGKLLYEQTAGALPLAGPAVPVVVEAHLYGVIGGLLAALCIRPQPVRL
jgi:membrane associated rhomboid family serine protease